MYRVLFVCMGNICRSPAAESVVRAMIRQAGLSAHIEVDSAGTHAYHEGESPDPRVGKVAAKRSYDLRGMRARRIAEEDFARFDRILAMDRQNLASLYRRCPPEFHDKLGLFMEFAQDATEEEIPDPYYGGAEGFEQVFDLCELAGKGLIAAVTILVGERLQRRS